MSEQGSVEAGQKAYLANSAIVNFGLPPSVASLCTLDQLRRLHYIDDLRLPYPRHRPRSAQAYAELIEWIAERLDVDRETLSYSHHRVIRDYAKRALDHEFEKLRTYRTPNLASARARAAAANASRMHAHTPRTQLLRHLIPEVQRQRYAVANPEPARRPHVANVRSLAAAAAALAAGAVGESVGGTLSSADSDRVGTSPRISTTHLPMHSRAAATAASSWPGSPMPRQSPSDVLTPWATFTPDNFSPRTQWRRQGYRSGRGAGGVNSNQRGRVRFSQDFGEDRGRSGLQAQPPYSPLYPSGYQIAKGMPMYQSSYWNQRGNLWQNQNNAINNGYSRRNNSSFVY